MEGPEKPKIELPYDPAIPLLGTHLNKILIQKDTCTPVFTAALFTIAKTQKEPKCPSSTDEWIIDIYIYICNMYYIHIQNGILLSLKEKECHFQPHERT